MSQGSKNENPKFQMSSKNIQTPYNNLVPDLILAAVESAGLKCTGTLFSLNSYENRVYQIGIEDSDPIIAKFYRPHRWTDGAILEEHQFAYELADLEIPVVAPLNLNQNTLHHYQDYRFALFPRLGGRALDLNNLDHLEWIGRFLGRLHAVGVCRTFQYRTRLNTENFGYSSYYFLLNSHFVPEYLKLKFSNIVESLLATIENKFQQLNSLDYIRLHGDCHPGNVLWKESGPHIVDLDDCMMGPAIQDIWMMLSGDEVKMQVQLDRILNGYYDFHDFNPAEIGLIEPLRALRILHYAAWLAKRWNDPAFPIHFPFFNTDYYWQELLLNLLEQQKKLNSHR